MPASSPICRLSASASLSPKICGPVAGRAISMCGTVTPAGATLLALSSLRPPRTMKSSRATAALTKKLAAKVVIGLSGSPAFATTPLVMPP